MSVNKLFQASNEVSIDSDKVKIPASNGNTFVERNRIVFTIDPQHQFLSMRECLLEFDIKLNNNEESCYLPRAGAQRLIKSCRIQTKDGKVLENITNYNVMASYMYDYSLTSGEKDARSLTELAEGDQINAGEFRDNLVIGNQFLQPYKDGTNPSVAKKDVTQRVVLKLWSKIFDNYENEVVYPNVFTGGTQIIVELEDATKCLEVIPQLNSDVREHCATIDAALNTSGNPHAAIAVKNENAKGINGGENDMKGCPFNVSQRVRIQLADGTSPDNTSTIASIQVDGSGRYELTLTSGFTAGVNYPAGSNIGSVITDITTNYTISNPSVICCRVNVPDSWRNSLIDLVSENKFRYNMKSINNVEVSQQSGATNFTNYINSNATSVSAVLSIANDSQTASNYTTDLLRGKYEKFNDYNYNYNNTTHPTLPVPVTKLNTENVSQEHISELVKANDSFWGTKSLKMYHNCFAMGRQFAPYNGAMRLTGKDLSHRIATISGQSLSTNMVFNNYLVRNIQMIVSKDGVEIIE